MNILCPTIIVRKVGELVVPDRNEIGGREAFENVVHRRAHLVRLNIISITEFHPRKFKKAQSYIEALVGTCNTHHVRLFWSRYSTPITGSKMRYIIFDHGTFRLIFGSQYPEPPCSKRDTSPRPWGRVYCRSSYRTSGYRNHIELPKDTSYDVVRHNLSYLDSSLSLPFGELERRRKSTCCS